MTGLGDLDKTASYPGYVEDARIGVKWSGAVCVD